METKDKNYWWATPLFIIAIGGILFLLAFISYKYDHSRLNTKVIIRDTTNTKLIDSIYDIMIIEKVRFRRIVLSQAILETQYFKSRNFIVKNNLFGFFVPYRRYFFGTNSGDFGSYASYTNITNCIKDYKSYQSTFAYSIYTSEGYYKYLQESYAEDLKYIQKLKLIERKLDDRFD